MQRTTISLPDNLARALHHEARRRRASISEVTRTALAQHLGLNGDGPRELPFAELGHSGRHTTARDMETLLEQEWSDLAGGR